MRTATIILAFGLITSLGCGTNSPSPMGGVQFTASGEVLAFSGYGFPPATLKDPAFVDGWQISFDRLLVTFDNINLSENPDKSPTDQAQTDQMVAQVKGPWAVDLHKQGELPGKGGAGETAVKLTDAVIRNQNLNRNAQFDETKRYAFGFDIVAATASAKKINLDAAGLTDYNDMVSKGQTVLYVGTATFKGGSSCITKDATYDFTKLPTTVKFKFGFKSPTSYNNCQNKDNDPAAPFPKEEHQRGVYLKNRDETLLQATVHTDHPFWESFVHDSPPHFDQLAAQAKKQADGSYLVTLDDVANVDFTAFSDSAQPPHPLPWRSCLSSYDLSPGNPMSFDTLGIPYVPNGNPTQALRGYAGYMTYSQSTQGHLNADGLCFVSRHYPSPP
jgi:hypothetical protein